MQTTKIHREIGLMGFDTSLSEMRLIQPAQIKYMERSIQWLGQLQPVIVRGQGPKYQIIDGFKRYYASQNLGIESLTCLTLDIPLSTAKVMILNYNKDNKTMVDYEEAMIVYSLKKDHLMDQEAISQLTNRSRSWVCRRLLLIERLDAPVLDLLKLGKLTTSQAREIIKLPRGNQKQLASLVINNNLTTRQSSVVIDAYLNASGEPEQGYILTHPFEVIQNREKEKAPYDCRLSLYGNRLLKTIEILTTSQHILIGQMHQDRVSGLTSKEQSILSPKLKNISIKSRIIHEMINKNLAGNER